MILPAASRPPVPRWRSLLFVSADDPVRLAKAASRGADAVIVDLEDAVASDRKENARAGLAESIDGLVSSGQPVVVRVNSGWNALAADLAVAIRPGVVAIMLPKVEAGWRITALAEMIAEAEVAHALRSGAIGIIALVESAAGLAALSAIVAAPRIIGLALGSEDLALALGVAPTPAFLDLPVRQIALAASIAGVMALALPLSIATFRDRDALVYAAALGRSYGATGALCIHPAQVEVANSAFSATAAELEEAQAILVAWAAGDGGGIVNLDGRMIDLPVLLRAQRLMGKAQSGH